MSEPAATTTAADPDPKSQQVPPTDPKGEATTNGQKPDAADLIPKARLDQEIAKRREYEKELEEFRKKQKDEEDAAAKAAGDIDKFSSENKTLRDQLDAYRKRDEARFEQVVSALSDEDKDVIAALGDGVSLDARLAAAEKLASRAHKQTDPGFGTSGGKAKDPGGLVPASVTNPHEYQAWLAKLTLSDEGRALLRDKAKMAALRDEARNKKLW